MPVQAPSPQVESQSCGQVLAVSLPSHASFPQNAGPLCFAFESSELEQAFVDTTAIRKPKEQRRRFMPVAQARGVPT